MATISLEQGTRLKAEIGGQECHRFLTDLFDALVATDHIGEFQLASAAASPAAP
jgi:hypothetical protein